MRLLIIQSDDAPSAEVLVFTLSSTTSRRGWVMRLQVRVLLSVASGGLVPYARAFIPASTSSIGRVACPTVSRSSHLLRSRSWSASSSSGRRRSLAHVASVEDGGSGGSGSRSSAVVIQDAERRAGSRGGSRQPAEVLDLKPPKGTRDVFPEDMRLRNW